MEITTKLSRLKSVYSIDDDYLEVASRNVLKNFVIFTGKHLCWSLFLIKLQVCKFIEKRLRRQCFPLHVRKLLRTPILKSTANGCFCLFFQFSNLFVFVCLFTIVKKSYDLSMKKMFIEIRLCNRMMYVIKVWY